MRFLLGMLFAVRGIERNGRRRLPQLWGRDPEVAEKVARRRAHRAGRAALCLRAYLARRCSSKNAVTRCS